MAQIKTPITQNKLRRSVPHGRMYVSATFNNTLVSITDDKGSLLCGATTGAAGFSGSRKSTPYAATITVENALNKAKAYGMNEVDIYLKGPGPGRDVALRVIRAQGLKVGMIADTTPDPHNGPRVRKGKHN